MCKSQRSVASRSSLSEDDKRVVGGGEGAKMKQENNTCAVMTSLTVEFWQTDQVSQRIMSLRGR